MLKAGYWIGNSIFHSRFSSFMVIDIGSNAINALAEALSNKVATKELPQQ
jgi:hypothetical protein